MSIFKCKMCGGSLEIDVGMTYGECPYCGSVTTFPSEADEKRANLYNMAEQYRQMNEFDKALDVYATLISEKNTDGEAYWGALLTKYGIEYVLDPQTQERIPTCHRVHKNSILSDELFVSACQYATDEILKQLYTEQAKKIAEIQKAILKISEKEDPYDIFICYKETGNDGTRTQDSVLAQDLYEQLCDKGYRVFFARVTLEGKLGADYESIIFAALNSAKVMLAIGTTADHYNAVWVKNEWSRFLSLMKTNKEKVLIPCYSEMNPYDLPDEMKMLQSQDMSKVGFQQDLIRGIQKVVDAKSIQANAAAKERKLDNQGIASTEDEIKILLEDGNFQIADELCEKILDAKPDYAMAYFYKMMIDFRAKNEQSLLDVTTPFIQNYNFLKAITFATVQQKQKFADIEYNGKVSREKYKLANSFLQNKQYAQAALVFENLNHYSDSDDQAEFAKEQAYNIAFSMKKRFRLKTAAQMFSRISDYNDAAQLAEQCMRLSEKIKILAIASSIFCTVGLLLLGIYIYQTRFNWSSYYQSALLALQNSPYQSSAAFEKNLNAINSSALSRSDKISAYKVLYEKWKTINEKDQKNDTEKMLEIADFFLNDSEFKNPNIAFEYFRMAATAGSCKAMKILSDGYLTGKPKEIFSANTFLAAQWAYKAALSGDSESGNRAMDLLEKDNTHSGIFYRALCFVKGIGCKKDSAHAFELFQKLLASLKKTPEDDRLHQAIWQNLEEMADEGYTSVLCYMAQCYRRGTGVKLNHRKAAECFAKAAKLSDPIAMYELGFCFEQGMGVPANMRKASELYRKAIPLLEKLSEKKDAAAQYCLAQSFQYGRGCRENQSKAFEYYQKASASNPLAQNAVGEFYLKGTGVKKSQSEAFKYFSESARRNCFEGMFNLADCYNKGIGVTRDMKKAFLLYKRIAKGSVNNYKAQFMVAEFYRNMLIATDMDVKTASKKYKAKEYKIDVPDSKGDSSGIVFSIATGIAPSIQETVYKFWYNYARKNAVSFANLGIADAQYVCAKSILRGYNGGGSPDYKLAERYLLQAAKQNHPDAKFTHLMGKTSEFGWYSLKQAYPEIPTLTELAFEGHAGAMLKLAEKEIQQQKYYYQAAQTGDLVAIGKYVGYLGKTLYQLHTKNFVTKRVNGNWQPLFYRNNKQTIIHDCFVILNSLDKLQYFGKDDPIFPAALKMRAYCHRLLWLYGYSREHLLLSFMNDFNIVICTEKKLNCNYTVGHAVEECRTFFKLDKHRLYRPSFTSFGILHTPYYEYCYSQNRVDKGEELEAGDFLNSADGKNASYVYDWFIKHNASYDYVSLIPMAEKERDTKVLYFLGLLAYHDDNEKKSFYCFEKMGEFQDGKGYYAMASLLGYERAVQRKKILLMQKSAECKYTPAMIWLAESCGKESKTIKNRSYRIPSKSALAWYEEAARLKNSEACWKLIESYAEYDQSLCIKWLKFAAEELGDPKASYILGHAYQYGRAMHLEKMQIDFAEAKKWYKLCIKNGNYVSSDGGNGRRNLENLEKKK